MLENKEDSGDLYPVTEFDEACSDGLYFVVCGWSVAPLGCIGASGKYAVEENHLSTT